MKEQDEPIKGKEEQINENIYRAVSVYQFLISLPENIARTVFKAVVDDCYEVAELLDMNVAYGSLAKSLFENCYSDYYGDFGPIDQFINSEGYAFNDAMSEYPRCFDDDSEKKAEALVKNLANTLTACHHDTFPDRLRLVRTYPMFSIRPEEISEFKGFLSMVENRIREGLRRIDGKYDMLKTDYPVAGHCFYPLGYITFLYTWSVRQEHELEMMSLIYRWYCRGEVLDYVLEAFKRAKARSVIDMMWNLFTDTCRKDQVFKDVFQERYDKVMLPVSTHRFVFGGEVTPRIAALDPIPMECGGHTDAGEELLDKLWMELGPNSSKPFIKCTQAEFRALFSGRAATVKEPVVWCGHGKALADFLVCCQGICQQSNRKYLEERARPLFVRYKLGEKKAPFEVITMKKSNKYEENSMKRIFNRIGIKR